MEQYGPLYMYTIYRMPLDYPDNYVVRRFAVDKRVLADVHPWAVTSSLDAARRSVPLGLHCMGRHPEDEPQIIEVWF